MRVKKEIREERDDIYSFWKIVKSIPEDENDDTITRTDTKIDEATIKEINERIIKFESQKKDITKKINNEKRKLDLLNNL